MAAYKNSAFVGISIDAGSSMNGCTAYFNTVSSSSAAIICYAGCTLIDCASCGNTAQFGILANSGDSLIHCVASNNTGSTPISAGFSGGGCLMDGCAAANNATTATATATTGMGIYMNGSAANIINCNASGNKGDGINAVGPCLIKGNFADSQRRRRGGLFGWRQLRRWQHAHEQHDRDQHQLDLNLVQRNAARGNTTNYVIAAGNRVATIVTPAVTSSAISGSSGGSAFSTDSSANIAY